FFAPRDGEKLFARAKDGYDGVQPSGNSQMARNLVRLSQASGKPSYRALVEKTLKQFALVLRTNPSSVPTMALCLHEFIEAGAASANSGGKVEPPNNPKASADVVKAQLELKAARNGRRPFTLTLAVPA